MFLAQRSRHQHLIRCWMRTQCLSSSHSFCTISKAERAQRLADKYKPNTKMPSKIGQLAHIDADQLVYTPKYADGLKLEFYASHILDAQRSKSDSAAPPTPDLSNVAIFEYKKQSRLRGRGSHSEARETVQFLLFAAVSLGAPALLLGTMYEWPEWTNKMTGYMTSETFFYWTQAGFMAFLLTGFAVGLKRQIGSWMQMARRRVYGSTAFVSRMAMVAPHTLNIQYCHNTLFHRARLSHDIDLSDWKGSGSSEGGGQSGYFYLKPTVNEITQSPDVT